MFYVGQEFDKEKNKAYKTLDGAKKAAKKACASIYDEEGVKVYTPKVKLTDEVPEGATKQNADGSYNVYDEDGNAVGTISEEEYEKMEAAIGADDIEAAAAEAKGEDAEASADTPDAAQNEPEEKQGENMQPDSVESVHGKIQRVFDGKLRLRRAPSMDESAVCGVTLFTEKTVQERHTVGGIVFYKTLDGYFIKGDEKLVKFIQA